MIKNYIPQRFDGFNPLPNYASNVREYSLLAKVTGGYTITLAKITVGDSKSGDNKLSHAIFESFTDHGERRRMMRTRASGCDSEFVAVKSAMTMVGVEFCPCPACPSEDILRALGDWFKSVNPEISEYTLVSQSCH